MAQLGDQYIPIAVQVKLLLAFNAVREIYPGLLLKAQLLHKTVHAGEIEGRIVFFTGNQLAYGVLQLFAGRDCLPAGMAHNNAVLDFVGSYPH
ncbi:hypothetical protein D3C87_2023370 [compost metagenome]